MKSLLGTSLVQQVCCLFEMMTSNDDFFFFFFYFFSHQSSSSQNKSSHTVHRRTGCGMWVFIIHANSKSLLSTSLLFVWEDDIKWKQTTNQNMLKIVIFFTVLKFYNILLYQKENMSSLSNMSNSTNVTNSTLDYSYAKVFVPIVLSQCVFSLWTNIDF